MIVKYKAIIWDWNGTLLNDVHFSIECINHMLEERSLRCLSKENYRDVFDFPVRGYYERVGFDFDKESWNELAMEYMHLYWEGMKSCALFDDVTQILAEFNKAGLRQFILSAMESKSLNNLVRWHALDDYFDDVIGIENHFANGKDGMAAHLLNENKLVAQEVLVIGDTYHDFEVAEAHGMNCVLISRGHQSKARLRKTGVPVFTDLIELSEFLCEN